MQGTQQRGIEKKHKKKFFLPVCICQEALTFCQYEFLIAVFQSHYTVLFQIKRVYNYEEV